MKEDNNRERASLSADLENADRRDLMKLLSVGAGAFGLASLFGGNAFAGTEKNDKYVIVITHGAEDPNRAILALLLADVVASKGWGKVHVWMTLHGAELANKTKTERIESPIFKNFGSAMKIMETIRKKGGWFGVCPPCAEYFGAGGSDKHEFVEKAGGDWLMKNIQDASVLWM